MKLQVLVPIVFERAGVSYAKLDQSYQVQFFPLTTDLYVLVEWLTEKESEQDNGDSELLVDVLASRSVKGLTSWT